MCKQTGRQENTSGGGTMAGRRSENTSGGGTMAGRQSSSVSAISGQGNNFKSRRRLVVLLTFLAIDLICTNVLLLPWTFLRIRRVEDETEHYTLYGSLVDLYALSVLRILAAAYCLLRSYLQDDEPPSTPFDPYHPNGERKSREDLEEDALEEACAPWLRRYTSRSAFPCEFIALVCSLTLVIKCFARLNVEIGVFDDAEPWHPLFWAALCLVAVFCVVESVMLESVGLIAGEIGRRQRQLTTRRRSTIMSACPVPTYWRHCFLWMLGTTVTMKKKVLTTAMTTFTPKERRGSERYHRGRNFSAGWRDLLGVCAPDAHLIALAFVFLLCAAMAQVSYQINAGDM